LKWWQWVGIGLGFFDPLSALTTVLAVTGTVSASALTTASVAAGTSVSLMGSVNLTSLGFSNALSGADLGVSFFGAFFKDSQWGANRFKNWASLEGGRFNSFLSTFKYDKSANWLEWPMQVINNISVSESLQDNIGNGFGHLQNIGGYIDDVGSYQGRTIVRLKGNYIGKTNPKEYHLDIIYLGII